MTQTASNAHSMWELVGTRLPPFLLTLGSPKDACLAHCFYTLFTHDCCAFFPSNHIVKFADDTTVLGLINNNDETAYRNEVQHLALWCDNNSLVHNIKKTKEIIVDFRKTGQYKTLSTLYWQWGGGESDRIYISGGNCIGGFVLGH